MIRKSSKKTDAFTLLHEFQNSIFNNKPSVEKMVDDIRMMHFRIRPLQGDVSLLNFMDSKLIETLWNLGKLDELYRKKQKLLNGKEREVFTRFFDSMQARFQKELNRVKLVAGEQENLPSIIEMEVFREDTRKKKAN